MNPDIINQRMTGQLEGDFCVFLIGMRINRPWKIHKWLPVGLGMRKMMKELAANKEIGYLGGNAWTGRTAVVIQYWRSTEHLMNYARCKTKMHLPAWQAFTKSVGDSGDVGIWHETYSVKEGAYETIYHNMPPYGLGAVGSLTPATGHKQSAKGRMKADED